MNIVTPPGSLQTDEIEIRSDLLARFAAIVGEKSAITDPALQEPYLREMRDLSHGRTPMVLRPGSVADVSAILRLANETKTPIVPQGGNTGLVGGQVPHHGEIVLSLNRLDRIREVDATSNTITAEAERLFAPLRSLAGPARRAWVWRCVGRAPAKPSSSARATIIVTTQVVLIAAGIPPVPVTPVILTVEHAVVGGGAPHGGGRDVVIPGPVGHRAVDRRP